MASLCGCSCQFYHQYHLPCAHIFAVLNLFQVKRIVKKQKGLIKERWLRKAGEQSDMAVIDVEDRELDNPYLIQLTTRDRLSGADRDFGRGIELDGHLICK